MILSCPACAASFELPDSALGPNGRKVRCSACGHVWRAGAPAEAEAAAASGPEAEAAPEPAAVTPPQPQAEIEPVAAESGNAPLFTAFEADRAEPAGAPPPAERPRRRSGLLLGWLVLVLVLFGLPALAWVERQRVVETVPETAALYALFGLEVETPLAGLRLQDVTLVRRTIDGRRLLIVEGSAANQGMREVMLPPLRARLLDGEGTVVQSWVFLAQRTHLAPGETAPFRTETENIPDEASINIEFLPDGSR